jgi:hypothetical protein
VSVNDSKQAYCFRIVSFQVVKVNCGKINKKIYVPQLKEFLKCRGRTRSLARKAELLRLCELALELQLEVIANDDYVDMVSSRRTVIDSDTNNNSQMIMRSVRDVI